jgi:hypothetical protein
MFTYLKNFYIISEKWKEDKISIYIFSLKGEEIEAYDIKAPSHSFEEAIKRFLKERVRRNQRRNA